jgi:ABC-type bacteriocin/lantibiotic exporter with double-glycine peptidase domain
MLSQMEELENSAYLSYARHVSELLTGVDHGRNVVNQRTSTDRAQSFDYVKQYIRKEKGTFLLGMVYLVLGITIDLAVPIYIGLVTDEIATTGGTPNMTVLINYTLIVGLIIGVSIYKFKTHIWLSLITSVLCILIDWKCGNWLQVSALQQFGG